MTPLVCTLRPPKDFFSGPATPVNGGSGRNPIANRQSLVFSERGQLSQGIVQFHVDKCCTNERQSHYPNRSTRNAGSMRTNVCLLEGDMSHHHMTANERSPGGFQTGGFPTCFGKGPDCVADPFGTVPRRCSY